MFNVSPVASAANVWLDDRDQRGLLGGGLARLVERRRHRRRQSHRAERLRQALEQCCLPADQENLRHGSCGVARRAAPSTTARTAPSVIPSSSTIFDRERSPARILIDRRATAKVCASNSTSSSLAAPSTGGAISRTLRPSPYAPTTSLRAARGCTRIASRTRPFGDWPRDDVMGRSVGSATDSAKAMQRSA